MRLNNGNKIITDTDILMTGQHLGESLNAVLDSQSKDISELRSNVKYIYEYGAMGNGGGGGGGSTTAWSIYATLNGTQINGNAIILDGGQTNTVYPLYIKINNPAGGTFKVTYTYKNKQGYQTPSSTYLNLDNSYMLSTSVVLNTNDTIQITVLSEDDEEKQVYANFITDPYSFDFYFGDKNEVKYTIQDNDLFISDITRSKLYAYFSYNIGISGTATYKFTDFNGNVSETQSLDLVSSKTGVVQLEVAPESFYTNNDNAGYYSAKLTIVMQPDNQQAITINKIISCNLIPSSLYLKLTPSALGADIYDTNDVEEPYEFSLGNVGFKVQAYYGQNGGRTFQLQATLDDVPVSAPPLEEREQPIYTYVVSTSGWHKIYFKLIYGNQFYEVTKYFYVAESDINLEWDYFRKSRLQHYYINSEGATPEFNQLFGGNQVLEQSVTSGVKEVILPKDFSTDIHDVMINFSIQYSEINDNDEPIITLLDSNNTTSTQIKIYQNKVTLGNNDISIYLPDYESMDKVNQEKYHLITIYKKYCTTLGTTRYYEFLVYIDGKLEGATSTYISTEVFYKTIQFSPKTYYINLFDVMYFGQNINEDGNEIGCWTDADIVQFFYTYELKYGKTVNDFSTLVAVNELCKNFITDTVDLVSGADVQMVSIDNDTLTTLAQKSDAAMLLFDFTDTSKYTDVPLGDNTNFCKWYQKYIKETEEDTTGSLEVAVSYSQNKSGFQPISHPGTFFTIKKQGTSTKNWFAKNLNLTINARDDDDNFDYVFSPNYLGGDNADYNTFLPEQTFTLKADVIDSAHANNNAIAQFVNENTNKFDTGDSDNKYYPYIKNCLTGYPCLVFVRTSYEDTVTHTTTYTTYYLGYYNFNLGRDSFYNLGYKPLNNLNHIYEGEVQNGFHIYSIPKDYNDFKPEFEVAEIQNNGEYYDFSQYDSSIMFGADTSDAKMMWGDIVAKRTDAQVHTDIQNFVKSIAKAGGYVFKQLGKRFGDHNDEYKAAFEDGSSKNQVPRYLVQYEHYLPESSSVWQYRPIVNASGQYIDPTTGSIPTEGTESNVIMTLQGDEEQNILPSLDYDSAIEYYVICMAFAMLDSVEKNMNIKSWTSGNTWYIAFYDMDTALNKDNDGQPVSYFAFSDYWSLPSAETTQLSEAVVFRDFFPKQLSNSSDNKGFDTPSSYLFALVKYAYMLLGNKLSNSNFPLRYWAKLRANNGPLRNAKWFIDKYYSGRTNVLGEALINLNYRAKYFVKSDTGYIGDFSKFQGTCQYSTQKWLSNRLHIVDVYMGLVSTSDTSRPVQYLNDKNEWVNLYINNVLVQEPNITAPEKNTDNDDIVVYKDIFSTEGQKKYSETIDVNIQALENSFVVIATPDSVERYLIKDPDVTYSLHIPTHGSNNVVLGGSDRWTFISDLAPFITNSSRFVVNSTNLRNFNLTGIGALTGEPLLGSFLPAVNNVTINGSKYDCTLTADSTIFPNITSININNSKVQLNVRQLGVQEISAQNVNSSSFVATGCENLESLSLSNSKFTDRVSINPYKGNVSFTNITCKQLEVVCDGENRTATISNNETLETLNLSNFSEVTISNCPKLKTVTLTASTLKSLKVIKCGYNTSEPLTINSTTPYTVDLQSASNLTDVDFSSNGNPTYNFKYVKLPNGCKLANGCFSGTGIQTLTSNGVVYITGSNTFYNTPFRGTGNLRIIDGLTSLSGTFYSNGNMTLADVTTFINNLPDNNVIINIDNLFRGQHNIVYGKSYINEYKSNTCSIKLSKFSKVTSATYTFAGTQVDFFNRYMFKNFGSTTVNMDGFFGGEYEGQLYCTLDSFNEIMPKLTALNIFYSWNNTRPIILIDNNGNRFSDPSDVRIKELFNNDTISTANIKSITRMYYSEPYDFTGFFDSVNWASLESITWSFDSINIRDFSLVGLNTLPKLNYIYASFNNIRSSKHIDLERLLNWNVFLTTTNNELLRSCFGGPRKYITRDGWNNIWSLINANTNITYVGNIFSYTSIISPSDYELTLPSVNIRLNSLENTFSHLSIVNSKADNDIDYATLTTQPIILDNFITYIPNVTYFHYTFAAIKLAHTLPYNFFKRRYKANAVTKYIVRDNINTGERCNLYEYKYTQNITSLRGIFEGVTIDSNRYFDQNEFESLPENYLTNTSGEVIPETLYCDKIDGTTYKTIRTNYEIYDARNVKVRHNYGTYNNINTPQINQLVDGEYDNLMLCAPDILYGCTAGCDIAYMFNGSQFAGALPVHLLSPITSGNVYGWLNNVQVMPRYVGTYKYSISDTDVTTKKVYVFVPAGFCNRSSYSHAFNFRLRFPVPFSSKGVSTVEAFYVFLDKSFNIIPQFINESLPTFDYNYNYDSYHNDGYLYYNVMFNTSLINTETNTAGNDGISFTNMRLNGLFNWNYLNFGYGLLFSNTSIPLNNYPLNTGTGASEQQVQGWAIYFYNSNFQNILPSATKLLTGYVDVAQDRTVQIQSSKVLNNAANYYVVDSKHITVI